MTPDSDPLATGLTRRKFGIGLAFACVAGVAAARQPYKRIDYLGREKLDDILPTRVGKWQFVSSSGLVVPPEDQLSRALYSDLVTRVYADGHGSTVMLLVAQSGSQTGILQVHRPEICYSAGGYQLSDLEAHQVRFPHASLPTMSLAATSDGRTEYIEYWTRIGNHLPMSWRQQRWAVARDNLNGDIPDAVLARVSAVSSDRQAAFSSIDQFIGALLEAMSPAGRRVLVGERQLFGQA